MKTPASTHAVELFDKYFESVENVVVVSYVDIETAKNSTNQRRRDADNLERAWNVLSQTSSVAELQAGVMEARADGIVGLHWCCGRTETVSVLATIYERIIQSKYADGFNAGCLGNGVGFVIIWLDRCN